jgi:hypothetical protein
MPTSEKMPNRKMTISQEWVERGLMCMLAVPIMIMIPKEETHIEESRAKEKSKQNANNGPQQTPKQY